MNISTIQYTPCSFGLKDELNNMIQLYIIYCIHFTVIIIIITPNCYYDFHPLIFSSDDSLYFFRSVTAKSHGIYESRALDLLVTKPNEWIYSQRYKQLFFDVHQCPYFWVLIKKWEITLTFALFCGKFACLTILFIM